MVSFVISSSSLALDSTSGVCRGHEANSYTCSSLQCNHCSTFDVCINLLYLVCPFLMHNVHNNCRPICICIYGTRVHMYTCVTQTDLCPHSEVQRAWHNYVRGVV